MDRNIVGEAIEVIDAEASVYRKRFVIIVKLYASFVKCNQDWITTLVRNYVHNSILAQLH